MTNPFSILIWAMSFILIQGCGSSENHQNKNSDETTRPDTVTMNNDSLPPPPKPGPAPRQARIHGEVIDVQKPVAKQDFVIVTFRLTGIDAYGSSTPPLAAGDSLKVKTKKSTIEKEEISSGKIVTAVISYRQVMLGYAETPRWSLVAID